MAGTFDPYQSWLGIPSEQQPPDYYRLLGLRRFEKDPGAIEAAADARIVALRPHEAGEQADACRKLLAEIRTAKTCLLNEARRAAYDLGLLQKMAAAAATEERPSAHAQISADAFLDILAAKDLVPPQLLLSLRHKVAEARVPIAAGGIATLLIDKGLLTPALARRLLSSEPMAAPPAGAAAARPRLGAEDELSLVPLEEELRKTVVPQPPAAKTPRNAAAGQHPSAPPIAAPPAFGTSGNMSLLDEELAAPLQAQLARKSKNRISLRVMLAAGIVAALIVGAILIWLFASK